MTLSTPSQAYMACWWKIYWTPFLNRTGGRIRFTCCLTRAATIQAVVAVLLQCLNGRRPLWTPILEVFRFVRATSVKYCYVVMPIGALGAAMPRGGPVMHQADLFPLEEVAASQRHQTSPGSAQLLLLRRRYRRPKGRKARNTRFYIVCL